MAESATYDVFISYCKADKAWVQTWLLPRLETAGLTVCIDDRDFALGAPRLENIENAVDGSRHTLIVMTPEWVTSEWNEFEALLVGSGDPAARKRRLLPLLLKPCELPRRIAMLEKADLTNVAEREAQFARVLKALGAEAPRPAPNAAVPPGIQPEPPRVSPPSPVTPVEMLPPPLADALDNHTLALFIGGDLPATITGVPARADLAHGLANKYRLDASLSLDQVAQRVEAVAGRHALTSYILDALDIAGKALQTFHHALVELVSGRGVQTIITTAYDQLLERALQRAEVGIHPMVRDSDLAFARPGRLSLFKLYGDVGQPDSLVVTDQDHGKLLRDRSREAFVAAVRQVLGGNTVLFIGYNLADPDMRFIWDQIAQNRFARRAYAVWPGLPQADVEMWRDRGIEILEQDPFGFIPALSSSPVTSRPGGG
ncbi:MAG: SIR2 family protein [Anaerolineae bacterium]